MEEICFLYFQEFRTGQNLVFHENLDNPEFVEPISTKIDSIVKLFITP